MTIDFLFYLSLFLRRLHYFLILFCLGAAVGITFAIMLPPVYRAEAVLIVESQQIPSDLAESTVRTETTEQLQIIQQRILTRDSLLDMANRLNIYAPVSGQDVPRRLAADEIVANMRARISIATTGGVTRGAVQATIVRVSFKAPTAAMSAAVTNEVVTLILQENVEIRTVVAGETLEFFTEEVRRLDREISTLGAEILAFQEDNIDSLPDSLDFRRSQQAAAQERLAQVEREEALIRDRRERLVSLYESTGSIGSEISATQLTPAAIQLQRLKDELSGMLAVLAPTNPRVKVLEAQVAALERTVAEQTAASSGLAEDGTQLSPYEIQLADIDGQLSFLAAMKEGIVSTMDGLRQSIEATPGNAIVLDTLERDYAALRAQYDQAVANRARAETGDTIEALSKGQRISVIEQAVPPREPESPNRRAMALAGIAAGIMMGTGFIVLLELFNTAVRRPVDLTNKLGITAFGTVPHIRTNWEIVRRRMIILAAFAFALVAIPAGLWFVHTQVMPLDLLLGKVRERLGV